ncbi:hypothetical protein BC831DRAFT_471553, partial [Entophlyctis helioformis]
MDPLAVSLSASPSVSRVVLLYALYSLPLLLLLLVVLPSTASLLLWRKQESSSSLPSSSSPSPFSESAPLLASHSAPSYTDAARAPPAHSASMSAPSASSASSPFEIVPQAGVDADGHGGSAAHWTLCALIALRCAVAVAMASALATSGLSAMLPGSLRDLLIYEPAIAFFAIVPLRPSVAITASPVLALQDTHKRSSVLARLAAYNTVAAGVWSIGVWSLVAAAKSAKNAAHADAFAVAMPYVLAMAGSHLVAAAVAGGMAFAGRRVALRRRQMPGQV